MGYYLIFLNYIFLLTKLIFLGIYFFQKKYYINFKFQYTIPTAELKP